MLGGAQTLLISGLNYLIRIFRASRILAGSTRVCAFFEYRRKEEVVHDQAQTQVPSIIINIVSPHLNPCRDGVEIVEEGEHRIFQRAKLIAPSMDCGLYWMIVHNFPLALVLEHIS